MDSWWAFFSYKAVSSESCNHKIEWFRRKRRLCVWLVNWDDVTRWGRDWDRDVRLPQFRLLLMRPQPWMRPSLPITSLKQDLLREIWIYALFTECSVWYWFQMCAEKFGVLHASLVSCLFQHLVSWLFMARWWHCHRQYSGLHKLFATHLVIFWYTTL